MFLLFIHFVLTMHQVLDRDEGWGEKAIKLYENIVPVLEGCPIGNKHKQQYD